jgi:hypothetical protein
MHAPKPHNQVMLVTSSQPDTVITLLINQTHQETL